MNLNWTIFSNWPNGEATSGLSYKRYTQDCILRALGTHNVNYGYSVVNNGNKILPGRDTIYH